MRAVLSDVAETLATRALGSAANSEELYAPPFRVQSLAFLLVDEPHDGSARRQVRQRGGLFSCFRAPRADSEPARSPGLLWTPADEPGCRLLGLQLLVKLQPPSHGAPGKSPSMPTPMGARKPEPALALPSSASGRAPAVGLQGPGCKHTLAPAAAMYQASTVRSEAGDTRGVAAGPANAAGPDAWAAPKSAAARGAAAEATGKTQLGSACLDGLPVIVTAFTSDGSIRHQNAASQAYYGRRGGDAEAGPGGASPMAQVLYGRATFMTHASSSCQGLQPGPEDALRQLFALDPSKLDHMLERTMVEGGVWEGIIRVPACLNPGPLADGLAALLLSLRSEGGATSRTEHARAEARAAAPQSERRSPRNAVLEGVGCSARAADAETVPSPRPATPPLGAEGSGSRAPEPSEGPEREEPGTAQVQAQAQCSSPSDFRPDQAQQAVPSPAHAKPHICARVLTGITPSPVSVPQRPVSRGRADDHGATVTSSEGAVAPQPLADRILAQSGPHAAHTSAAASYPLPCAAAARAEAPGFVDGCLIRGMSAALRSHSGNHGKGGEEGAAGPIPRSTSLSRGFQACLRQPSPLGSTTGGHSPGGASSRSITPLQTGRSLSMATARIAPAAGDGGPGASGELRLSAAQVFLAGALTCAGDASGQHASEPGPAVPDSAQLQQTTSMDGHTARMLNTGLSGRTTGTSRNASSGAVNTSSLLGHRRLAQDKASQRRFATVDPLATSTWQVMLDEQSKAARAPSAKANSQAFASASAALRFSRQAAGQPTTSTQPFESFPLDHTSQPSQLGIPGQSSVGTSARTRRPPAPVSPTYEEGPGSSTGRSAHAAEIRQSHASEEGTADTDKLQPLEVVLANTSSTMRHYRNITTRPASAHGPTTVSPLASAGSGSAGGQQPGLSDAQTAPAVSDGTGSGFTNAMGTLQKEAAGSAAGESAHLSTSRFAGYGAVGSGHRIVSARHYLSGAQLDPSAVRPQAASQCSTPRIHNLVDRRFSFSVAWSMTCASAIGDLQASAGQGLASGPTGARVPSRVLMFASSLSKAPQGTSGAHSMVEGSGVLSASLALPAAFGAAPAQAATDGAPSQGPHAEARARSGSGSQHVTDGGPHSTAPSETKLRLRPRTAGAVLPLMQTPGGGGAQTGAPGAQPRRIESAEAFSAQSSGHVQTLECGTASQAVRREQSSCMAAAPNAEHGAQARAGGDWTSQAGEAGAEAESAPREARQSQQMQASGDLDGGLAWHEVRAAAVTDPDSGARYLVVMQKDVTSKVEAERHIAQVSEIQHRLLEQIFPRHVLAYMTEEGFAPQTGEDAPAGEAAEPEDARGSDASLPSVSGEGSGGPATWRPYVRDCTRLATWHPQVTVLFADIQGFTPMCKQLPPTVVMKFLNDLFVRFDSRLDHYGVYKVETIGDCYVVAGGLITEDADGMAAVQGGGESDPHQADRVFAFAQAMIRAASRVTLPTTGEPVKIRVGIHSGPVVSGVVGTRMPRFCLFGDTINTASRMESTSQPGCVHISSDTYFLLTSKYEGWAPTGGIEVKGKGLMETHLWTAPVAAPQPS